MRVSVVIPTYNRAATLPRAVESALRQSRPPYEVLVIDDGSTDETAEIIRNYGSPVRHVLQENAGASSARNRGIAEATGEWVAFLDSDDEWLPNKLADQLSILEQYPELCWGASRSIRVGADGVETISPWLPRDQREIDEQGFLEFFKPRIRPYLFTTPGIIVKRSVFDRVGEFDTRIHYLEDFELWCRVALMYPTFAYSPEPGYRWYVGSDLSLTKGQARHLDVYRVLDSLLSKSKAADSEVRRAIRRWVQFRAFNYYVQFASRRRLVDAQEIQRWRMLAPPTLLTKTVVGALRLLPAALAQRIDPYVRECAVFLETRG